MVKQTSNYLEESESLEKQCTQLKHKLSIIEAERKF